MANGAMPKSVTWAPLPKGRTLLMSLPGGRSHIRGPHRVQGTAVGSDVEGVSGAVFLAKKAGLAVVMLARGRPRWSRSMRKTSSGQIRTQSRQPT